MLTKTKAAVAASGLAIGLIAATASSASAATLFSEGYGSGSYHASSDYVPGAGNILVGSYCGSGGAATHGYTELRTTSGSHVNSSRSSACDGAWHDDNRVMTYASSGVSYYQRWYGQNGSLINGYSAPWAGVRAFR